MKCSTDPFQKYLRTGRGHRSQQWKIQFMKHLNDFRVYVYMWGVERCRMFLDAITSSE
jgi:hypothetical protein